MNGNTQAVIFTLLWLKLYLDIEAMAKVSHLCTRAETFGASYKKQVR